MSEPIQISLSEESQDKLITIIQPQIKNISKISPLKVFVISLWSTSLLYPLILIIYSFIYVDGLGYFLKQGLISLLIFIIITCLILINQKLIKKPKYLTKRKLIHLITTLVVFLLSISVSIWITITIADIQSKFPEFCYGPLAFIHDDGTRINWCTYKMQKSYLPGYPSKSKALSNFHSVFVNSTSFNYSIPGRDTVFNYHLPSEITKFIVISDTHTNTKYTSTMSTDYDFMIHAGDLCNDGYLSEIYAGFQNWPTKPMLFTRGNHDYFFQFDHFKRVTSRPLHYHQKIGDLFFFSVYTQHGNHKSALKFLEANAHLALNSKHVFIVVHNPPYATGGHGANKPLSVTIEKFVDNHPELNLRAVFSGHNHVFAAFKRNQLLYFVNGVGGGYLHFVHSYEQMGERMWTTDELHGPQAVIDGDDKSYGYQYHLDSYLKYTRTEVTFEQNKIIYSIRDLDTNMVFKTYEEAF
ncbi:Alkaline_phosphatase [Hexamita inflata]|uniref:Alkaline phosphatase n=1 Tax=Hexamita inflata TaxID=28002 RepID=A0AA86TXG3_9EUKA|nr:Alkaline phosphatase [Hexamita inflata]